MPVPDEHLASDYHPRPFQLSINQIVALYPRDRLIVHPLCWSDRQLDLLGCRIHFRGEGGRGAGAYDEAVDRSSVRLARLLARRLNRWLSWMELIDTIARSLQPLGGAISIKHGQTARLYFNPRSRVSIEYCRMAVSIPGPADEKVTFACFDIDETGLLRRRLFLPSDRLGNMDLPGIYRLHTLLKRHVPADRQQDPYLVALVIALAQQERRRAAQPQPASSSFTVRILFTGKKQPAQFHLLVAHVRACFLDKLDFPGRPPPPNSGLDIYRWHIPTEPIATLARRLCWALRFDCCGGAHDVESTRSGVREGRGQKRKRDSID